MDIVYKVLLIILMTGGLAIIPLGLPGTFVILGSAFLYALVTGFSEITWGVLLVLLAAALVAEAAEALAGLAGAKKYGAGKAGVAAALIGGLAGAVIGAPFMLGVGAVPGAFIGAFLAASGVEMLSGRPPRQAFRAGLGTILGRVAGTAAKITIGMIMGIVCLVRIF